MRNLVFSLPLMLIPAMALADGFHTRDLGSGGSPQECMDRARQAIRTYAQQNGTPNATVNEGSWSVHGFDFLPGNVDVQIACPYRDNFTSIVLLTAHSSGERDDRVAVVDGIAALWDSIGQGGFVPGGK